MQYAEIKAALIGLINRSDMTDDLASQFINLAQIRLERILRPSFMQRFVSFSTNGNDGVFRVPADYLELISVFTDNGEMRRVGMMEWLRHPNSAGVPRCFIQTGHEVRMRPLPQSTDTIYLRYFGCEPILVNDTDTNQWSLCATDALLYGAAEYAADHFEDERLQRFSDRFTVAATELKEQQVDEDFSGPMSLQSTYAYPDEF